jgi:hypothetical protein
MKNIRLFDPCGLPEKEKELRALRKQIERLEDRETELREERQYHLRPGRNKKAATCK